MTTAHQVELLALHFASIDLSDMTRGSVFVVDGIHQPTRDIVQRALISAGFHSEVLFIHPRDPGPADQDPWPFLPMSPGDLAFYVTGVQHNPANTAKWLHVVQRRTLPPETR
jgi:hypothetical protein